MVNEKNSEIIQKINETFSNHFSDYRGVYLFGSRREHTYREDSDCDVILLFETIYFDKKLEIAGIIGDLEYELGIFIDYKLFTTAGEKSIESVRQNINPYFIQEAVDKGIFYGRE